MLRAIGSVQCSESSSPSTAKKSSRGAGRRSLRGRFHPPRVRRSNTACRSFRANTPTRSAVTRSRVRTSMTARLGTGMSCCSEGSPCRTSCTAERVQVEVQDECGGLASENVDELCRPFQQRGADRTGMGLGLTFSRLGVEANYGRIYARNLPERGASSASTCHESRPLPSWRRRLASRQGHWIRMMPRRIAFATAAVRSCTSSLV
jgi:hypothetical protein